MMRECRDITTTTSKKKQNTYDLPVYWTIMMMFMKSRTCNEHLHR